MRSFLMEITLFCCKIRFNAIHAVCCETCFDAIYAFSVWIQITPKILSVEKKWQISCMLSLSSFLSRYWAFLFAILNVYHSSLSVVLNLYLSKLYNHHHHYHYFHISCSNSCQNNLHQCPTIINIHCHYEYYASLSII